ncbi:MAG: M15 family metallopeptidase [Prevotella sp.]
MSFPIRSLSVLSLLLISLAASAQEFSRCPYHADTTQCELHLSHFDENGTEHVGVMICNKAIADDLIDIFSELYRLRYPIHSMRPASEYGGDDERSMRANNTSCYNVRRTRNGAMSRHARGIAVDINPLWNPCVHIAGRDKGLVEPSTAKAYTRRGERTKGDRRDVRARLITRDDPCYRLFIAHGFRWGGAWRSLKDYQHFER